MVRTGGSLFIIALLLAQIALVPFALAVPVQNGLPVNSCAIPTISGLVNDRDCDGLDDLHDNCKEVPNSDQTDANRNRVGDACDLLATQILLEPGTEVMQNTFFTVWVSLLNNKGIELKDVQARVRSTQLQIDLPTFISSMAVAEQRNLEFLLKAPCSAPGKYELVFTTDHKEGAKVYTQTLYQQITIVKNPTTCARNATTLDNTYLSTLTQQEVLAGESVIYPITITNTNDEAKSYRLGLVSVSDIGTYRIEPDASFSVPAGKSQTVYLHLQTEGFAAAGRRTLTLQLESDSKTEETRVNLRILKTVGEQGTGRNLNNIFQWVLIGLILLLVIVAVFVAFRNLRRGPREPRRPEEPGKPEDFEKGIESAEKDEEFKSYY
jgi:hypothetical protein